MKIFKKTLAMLLCLIMLMGIAPLSLSASAASYYFVSDSPFTPGEPFPDIYDSKGNNKADFWHYYDEESGKQTIFKDFVLRVDRTYVVEVYSSTRPDALYIEGLECTFAYEIRNYGDQPNIYAFYVNEPKKVSTWDELKTALESSKPTLIKLANDINKEIPLGDSAGGKAAQITISGSKALDLNGHKLNVRDRSDVSSDKDYTLDSIRTLFTVPAGAEFIVDDSVGKGEVKYDAHFIGPNVSIGLIIDNAWYTNVAVRNMFNVEGKLTVNGGKFDAGGAKEQYLSDKACNAHQIANGYIAKTEGSGEAVFNAGEFIGHTYAYYQYTYNYCYVLSGNILINGGDFINEGIGHMLDPENNSKIRIINGSFDAKTHSKYRITKDNGLENSCDDWYISSFEIPAGAWNKNESILVKDGKLLFFPDADYLESYNEDDRIDIVTPVFQESDPAFDVGKNSTSKRYVIGEKDYITYSDSRLPQYLIDKGYDLYLRGTLRDSSDKLLLEKEGNEVKINLLDYCKTPGTYKYWITFVLEDKDGKFCGLLPYTVIITAINPCETHDYYVSRTTATCTSGGTSTEICTKCGDTKTTNVGALGHTYEEYEGEYQWSYNSTNHWKYCWRCDKNFSQGKHTFNSNNICTACGLDNNCDYGNAMDMEGNEPHHWWPCDTHGLDYACPNDHKLEYGAHTVSPADGMGSTTANTTYNCAMGYVCEGCGNYFGETGNHTWVLASRTEPTCKSDGVEWYRCSNSGKIDPHGNRIACVNKKVTLPATGEHNYELKSDTSTCSKDGVQTFKCKSCGDTKTSPVSKTGHIYGLVSDTATCTSSGEATYKCNTCSASYKEVSPAKGHNHIEDSYVAPTTEAEGKITYKCTDCGDVKNEKLDKLSVIREPKTKSINCKDGVLIRPNFAVIPEGAKVEWTASNGCFNWSVDAEGNVKAISNSSGDTTFAAKVKLADGTYMTDMYGNEVVDQTTVKSNAGFFQKIIGFFKGLFGLTKIHE